MPFCDERHVAATTTRKRYGRGKWAATAVVGKLRFVVGGLCVIIVDVAGSKNNFNQTNHEPKIFWLVIGSDTNGHLLSSSINFVKGVVKRFCVVWILTGGP